MPMVQRRNLWPLGQRHSAGEQAKRDYDAFLAECPTRELLETLSDKWMGLVLGALAEDPKRHSELGAPYRAG